ncbi:uncharacterized protein M6B38_333905 [Iris pallida]|uniref:SANTA domain-containing protein n=1 Tax=Iris pallida TaxID=29817 RepID=A0AAX6H1J7_IRIPA|nr:uncharacterized protein M6B38_333905 [Iris pallida]
MVQKRTPKSHAKDPGSSPPASNLATADIPLNSTPATPFTPSSSSSFKKSVLLFDWWLFGAETDVDGKRLAVSGLDSRGQHATRVFNSAPIIKRFDAYTLETADGITVRIHGFINKSRTRHNGIPLEVSVRFLTGFPYNWEVYADEFFGNKPSSTVTSKRAHNVDEQLKVSSDGSCSIYPVGLDEFPMSNVLDVLNSTPVTSIEDLLKKSFTPMSKGNLDVEQTTHSAEFGIGRLSNDLLQENNFVSPPTTGSRFSGYALRSRSRAERTQVHNTSVSEGKDPDKKDHPHTLRSKSSSKKDKTAVSPSAISPYDEDQYHAEGERTGVDNRKSSIIETSGDLKGPPSNDIDEEGNIVGITHVDNLSSPTKGSKSLPPKKKNKLQ